MINTFLQNILTHKLRTFIILFFVIVLGYFGYKKFFPTVTPTMYVVSTVQKGAIIKTISGTGQISATNQVDIKAKASGDVLRTLVQNGQMVKAGDPIAYLDARDAVKTVRDAQVNLDSAKLAMEKLVKPADTLTLLQAQNAISTAQDNKDKASRDLSAAYENTFGSISNAFLNMPTIDTDLNGNLYSFTISLNERSVGTSQDNLAAMLNSVSNPDDVAKITRLETVAGSDYALAKQSYNKNFDDFKSVTRLSDSATLDSLLNETVDSVRIISQAAKSESNLFDTWVDIRTKNNLAIFSQINIIKTQLSSDISQLNSILSTLTNLQDTIKSAEFSIVSSDRTVAEKTQSLADLQAGAQPIDIQSQQLSLKQKENALLDAQEKLSDYTVRAPFDGVVAKLSIQKGDTLSSGTVAATLITAQQTVEISLNEVDVSKVKIGQKVNLTFDAIPDLNITGVVADIDAVGTVAQGVVTYNIKISLDTQDDRVKSGMSVAASVITDMKQDVVTVPNSALKTNGNTQYVEIPGEAVADNNLDVNSGIILLQPIKKQTVQLGISNDTDTEITSGLNAGDKIITRTITGSTKTTVTTGTSLLQQVGGRAATGGAAGGARNFGGAAAGR